MTGYPQNLLAYRPSGRLFVPSKSRLPKRRRALSIEGLEARQLPAMVVPVAIGVVQEAEPNDTADVAQSLGNLDMNGVGSLAVSGTIGRWANDVKPFLFQQLHFGNIDRVFSFPLRV